MCFSGEKIFQGKELLLFQKNVPILSIFDNVLYIQARLWNYRTHLTLSDVEPVCKPASIATFNLTIPWVCCKVKVRGANKAMLLSCVYFKN